MSTLAAVSRSAPVTRGEVAAALILMLTAGALAPLVLHTVNEHGLAALLDGGGVSWVVWLALGLAVRLALRAPATAATPGDLAVGAACLAAVALPVHVMINLAATALALRYALWPRMPTELRAAGLILLAIFVAIFWSSHIFPMFAAPLAQLDAWWVTLVLGVPVDGNIIHFQQGGGSFLLAGACTSVNNASLALLLWVAISRSARPQGSSWQWLTALAVFATAMAVNVTRLVLMSQSLEMFELLHNSVWVATAVTASGLAWGVWDARRELFR
jgi:hypothetical protein